MATPDTPSRETIRALRNQVRGTVLEPGEAGYDEARTIWNGMIDREPGVIVQCTGAADVMTAVSKAKDPEFDLAIKCGGHHVSGAAICDGGLIIDLSPMNRIRVDPDARTARVQAGATWGDIDHETQQFGLAIPGGQDPNIGVSGLTLGGGIGWLSRKYGLTSDNLLAADVVTADGGLVTASADRNPDLFWALRGGGGNFGVVTSFKFRLHRVGPEILAGSLIYPIEEFSDIVAKYETFVETAPREVRLLLGIMELPATPYYPEEVHNTRVVLLVVFYGGDPEKGKPIVAPLRNFRDPIRDSIQPRLYKSFQQVGKSGEIKRTYIKTHFLKTLRKDAIETIYEYGTDVPPDETSIFIAYHGGAETDPPFDATAYNHREDSHRVMVEARWSDPGEDAEHIDWVREFHSELQSYATKRVPVNFMTEDEGEDRIRMAYGENYERLQRIKAEWDPKNLFDRNQNIEPKG